MFLAAQQAATNALKDTDKEADMYLSPQAAPRFEWTYRSKIEGSDSDSDSDTVNEDFRGFRGCFAFVERFVRPKGISDQAWRKLKGVDEGYVIVQQYIPATLGDESAFEPSSHVHLAFASIISAHIDLLCLQHCYFRVDVRRA